MPQRFKNMITIKTLVDVSVSVPNGEDDTLTLGR